MTVRLISAFWKAILITSHLLRIVGVGAFFLFKEHDIKFIGLFVSFLGAAFLCGYIVKDMRGKNLKLIGTWIILQVIAPLLPIFIIAASKFMDAIDVNWYELLGGTDLYFYTVFVGFTALAVLAESYVEKVPKEYPLIDTLAAFLLTVVTAMITARTIGNGTQVISQEALTNRTQLIEVFLVFLIPISFSARVRSFE